ncbi:MAG: hypothetical protein Q4G18_08100 [Myroides sp.]|nr:hypothetical protein [Myroides sp.]MDO5637197.1 hypothetical protein [Myroides sp.]
MKRFIFAIATLLISMNSSAQIEDNFPQPKRYTFWSDVQFGGALGIGFGDNYTNISVAPSAIKPITEQVWLGGGFQFNYLKSKGFFESTSYGINLIGLYNPIPEIQLSAELEQLRVNNTWSDTTLNTTFEDNFWNTALFLGAGYSSGNATIGIRYNVLFKENNLVYSQAWMPFIRVYF